MKLDTEPWREDWYSAFPRPRHGLQRHLQRHRLRTSASRFDFDFNQIFELYTQRGASKPASIGASEQDVNLPILLGVTHQGEYSANRKASIPSPPIPPFPRLTSSRNVWKACKDDTMSRSMHIISHITSSSVRRIDRVGDSTSPGDKGSRDSRQEESGVQDTRNQEFKTSATSTSTSTIDQDTRSVRDHGNFLLILSFLHRASRQARESEWGTAIHPFPVCRPGDPAQANVMRWTLRCFLSLSFLFVGMAVVQHDAGR